MALRPHALLLYGSLCLEQVGRRFPEPLGPRLGCVRIGAGGGNIGLDLGLGAGRADDEARAPLQAEGEDIGLGRSMGDLAPETTSS